MTVAQARNVPTWDAPEDHFTATLSSDWYRAVSRLSSLVVSESFTFFQENGLAPVLAPITTRSISSPMGLGSDSLPVEINLFGEDVYLADSMQFHLEHLVRVQQRGVFYIMSSFRGENPDDTHLNEFFHVEAEILGTLDDVIDLVSRFILHLTRAILNKEGQLLETVGVPQHRLDQLRAASSIPRMTFAEARQTLDGSAAHFTFHENEPIGLSRLGERILMEKVGGPVWVTHYPEANVPFYQAIDSKTKNALNADLLLGIGETVGAGQRCFDASELKDALTMRGNPTAPYDWYLKLKQAHPLQTSGFGMGLERFLMWVLCHEDIRDIEIFLRTKGSGGIV